MMVKPSCCRRTLVHMDSSLSDTSEPTVADCVVGFTSNLELIQPTTGWPRDKRWTGASAQCGSVRASRDFCVPSFSVLGSDLPTRVQPRSRTVLCVCGRGRPTQEGGSLLAF